MGFGLGDSILDDIYYRMFGEQNGLSEDWTTSPTSSALDSSAEPVFSEQPVSFFSSQQNTTSSSSEPYDRLINHKIADLFALALSLEMYLPEKKPDYLLNARWLQLSKDCAEGRSISLSNKEDLTIQFDRDLHFIHFLWAKYGQAVAIAWEPNDKLKRKFVKWGSQYSLFSPAISDYHVLPSGTESVDRTFSWPKELVPYLLELKDPVSILASIYFLVKQTLAGCCSEEEIERLAASGAKNRRITLLQSVEDSLDTVTKHLISNLAEGVFVEQAPLPTPSTIPPLSPPEEFDIGCFLNMKCTPVPAPSSSITPEPEMSPPAAKRQRVKTPTNKSDFMCPYNHLLHLFAFSQLCTGKIPEIYRDIIPIFIKERLEKLELKNQLVTNFQVRHMFQEAGSPKKIPVFTYEVDYYYEILCRVHAYYQDNRIVTEKYLTGLVEDSDIERHLSWWNNQPLFVNISYRSADVPDNPLRIVRTIVLPDSFGSNLKFMKLGGEDLRATFELIINEVIKSPGYRGMINACTNQELRNSIDPLRVKLPSKVFDDYGRRFLQCLDMEAHPHDEFQYIDSF